MNHIRLVIDIKDATIQAIYSNFNMDIIVVDHDCRENEESPVQQIREPDVVNPFIYELYDSDTPGGLEIREKLQALKF
jgi:hypothetical protein